MWVSVGPWLATLTLWPVVIDSSNGDVEDQVVFLVEWSVLVGLVLPWVADVLWEFSLGEHVLVMLEVEHFSSVDGGDDGVLGPLESIDVEVVRQVSWVSVLGMSLVPGVHWVTWSEMEGRSKLVSTTG